MIRGHLNCENRLGLFLYFHPLVLAVGLPLAGCEFAQPPKVKASQTVQESSLGLSSYFSDDVKKNPRNDEISTHSLTRTVNSSTGVATYSTRETFTIDDRKYFVLNFEKPAEVRSLASLNVSAMLEWDGNKHPVTSAVMTNRGDKTAKPHIRIIAADILAIIGGSKPVSFELTFNVKQQETIVASIVIPARLPPVSVTYKLQNVSEYMSVNPDVGRDFLFMDVNGVELSLVQVAKTTNEEELPVKLQFSRKVAGGIFQDLQKRTGFPQGKFFLLDPYMGVVPINGEACDPSQHGNREERNSFGENLFLVPLNSSTSLEFEKSQKETSGTVVYVLKPKESLEIGLYAQGPGFREWRRNGPVQAESGLPTANCFSSLTCKSVGGRPTYYCPSGFKVHPLIASAGPTILALENSTSLMKASFFSDFKLTKTPPSYRIRVFREKSELPWRESL